MKLNLLSTQKRFIFGHNGHFRFPPFLFIVPTVISDSLFFYLLFFLVLLSSLSAVYMFSHPLNKSISFLWVFSFGFPNFSWFKYFIVFGSSYTLWTFTVLSSFGLQRNIIIGCWGCPNLNIPWNLKRAECISLPIRICWVFVCSRVRVRREDGAGVGLVCLSLFTSNLCLSLPQYSSTPRCWSWSWSRSWY